MVNKQWAGTEYFTPVAGYLIRKKELNDVIEKLKKLEKKVETKYCEIALNSANIKTCINEGESTKVLPKDAVHEGKEGEYCKKLVTVT